MTDFKGHSCGVRLSSLSFFLGVCDLCGDIIMVFKLQIKYISELMVWLSWGGALSITCVCVCFLCSIFSFVHECKTPKCTLAHYHQRITTAIIIDSFKFILYVTVMMHTFVQQMCTHHSFVLKSFLFSFMHFFLANTTFTEFPFISFHFQRISNKFLVHDTTDI